MTFRIQTGVQLAGASSDLILAELFKSPGRKNLFVRDELARAFRILAKDHEAPSWELAAIQSRLRFLVDNTPAGDPSIPVIRELLTLRPE